jgi:ElaB/YqjD/DUF883 family membrane-anchored ribosome-binding protein
MAESVFEKADVQVAESIHKLTRATSAMADAIDVIKRAVRRSGDVAEEFMDDATQRVKRHPVETMAATFALGVIVGGLIGWIVSRR